MSACCRMDVCGGAAVECVGAEQARALIAEEVSFDQSSLRGRLPAQGPGQISGQSRREDFSSFHKESPDAGSEFPWSF